jgi:DNA-binding MarR family transcriptional regulator
VNDIVDGAPGAEAPGVDAAVADVPGAEAPGVDVAVADVPGAEAPGVDAAVADVPGAGPGGTAGLAAEVMAAIGAIRRVARRAARAAWHAEPLPPAQSELLRLAAARPGISVADAAHELRLAPNTVSTLVGKLDAAGLLGRTRAPSDGRSVRLTVTGKGARRIAEFRDLRAELAGRALDRLTAADRQALAEAVPVLLRFAAQLAEEQP